MSNFSDLSLDKRAEVFFFSFLPTNIFPYYGAVGNNVLMDYVLSASTERFFLREEGADEKVSATKRLGCNFPFCLLFCLILGLEKSEKSDSFGHCQSFFFDRVLLLFFCLHAYPLYKLLMHTF